MITRRLLALLVLLCLSSGGLACKDTMARNTPPPGALQLQGAGASFLPHSLPTD